MGSVATGKVGVDDETVASETGEIPTGERESLSLEYTFEDNATAELVINGEVRHSSRRNPTTSVVGSLQTSSLSRLSTTNRATTTASVSFSASSLYF